MRNEFDADQEVIARILGGEVVAFAIIVEKYQKNLFRLGMRLLSNSARVDDILQDTFIKVFKKLDRFEGRSSFKSWLYQIFMNTLRNSLRLKNHAPLEEGSTMAIPFGGDLKIYNRQRALIIQQAIEQLPPRQKMAVTLRVYEDLSFDEVSQIMNCPYDTAKANFRHGIQKLKTLLEGLSRPEEAKSWDDSEFMLPDRDQHLSFLDEMA